MVNLCDCQGATFFHRLGYLDQHVKQRLHLYPKYLHELDTEKGRNILDFKMSPIAGAGCCQRRMIFNQLVNTLVDSVGNFADFVGGGVAVDTIHFFPDPNTEEETYNIWCIMQAV